MSDKRVAKASISDGQLLEALEQAEEEHGSMAAAVRHAIERTYGDGLATMTREKRAHKTLIEAFGHGSRVGLRTVESSLAQEVQVPKDEVRSTLLTPMESRGLIRIHQGLWDVSVVIPDVEARDSAATSAAQATDGGEARNRLEELSNAEVGQ